MIKTKLGSIRLNTAAPYGSVELLFLASFLLLSITACNTLIGLAITR